MNKEQKAAERYTTRQVKPTMERYHCSLTYTDMEKAFLAGVAWRDKHPRKYSVAEMNKAIKPSMRGKDSVQLVREIRSKRRFRI